MRVPGRASTINNMRSIGKEGSWVRVPVRADTIMYGKYIVYKKKKTITYMIIVKSHAS